MGTWGAGNFQNDSAGDYMDEVSKMFVDRIEECMADGDCRALDEMGEALIMPSVVILSTLHTHCYGALPPVGTVRRWKQTYLQVFDDEIDELKPAEGYKEERRAVIESTFATLEAQALAAEA